MANFHTLHAGPIGGWISKLRAFIGLVYKPTVRIINEIRPSNTASRREARGIGRINCATLSANLQPTSCIGKYTNRVRINLGSDAGFRIRASLLVSLLGLPRLSSIRCNVSAVDGATFTHTIVLKRHHQRCAIWILKFWRTIYRAALAAIRRRGDRFLLPSFAAIV